MAPDTPGPDAAADLGRVAELVKAVDGLPGQLADRSRELTARLRAVAARVVEPLDDLVVVVAGPTGSGKSSLVNALAGTTVSPAGVRRPTTATPVVWTARWRAEIYRRRGVGSVEPVDVVASDHPLVRNLTIVDAPDPDSVEREHALALHALIGVADLVVAVTTPNRYADAVPWEVFARSQRLGLPSLVVMNRVRETHAGRVQVGHLVARAAMAGFDLDLDEVLRLPERSDVGALAHDVVDLADVLAEVGADDAEYVAAYARRGAVDEAARGVAAWFEDVRTVVSDRERAGRRASAAHVAERQTITDELAASPPGRTAHGTVLLRRRDSAYVEGSSSERLVSAAADDLARRFALERATAVDAVRAAASAAGAGDAAAVERLLLATGGALPEARRPAVDEYLQHLAGVVAGQAPPPAPSVPEGLAEAIDELVNRATRAVPVP